MRKRWIWDARIKELVPIEEYEAPIAGPFVWADYSPYKSMKTGEMIQGRAQHREHLKRHDLIELGTEKVQPPKPIPVAPGLKETIGRIVYEKLQYK